MDASLTALIGREQEVARATALLEDPHIRLLTISGAGGVGKTRLAGALAAELGEGFADGVVVVRLDPISDPGLVLPTIARNLGLREIQDDPIEALKAHLRERRLLLVLDTFEHVLDAAPALADLLAACPGLKVAVTSRTRLRVSGEHEFALEPLSESDAVALFRERARAVEPDLQLSGDRLAAVTEICSRLDGLPLAIELAAARVKVLPPEAMRERLERRLELLTAGRRDAPHRQQTLRSTIDWSVGLLDEVEQELFWRLSVFVGGFTLDAAESVGGATLDTLGLLVDKSLVGSHDGRYRMLDTVREYASEQLESSGDNEDARRAHVTYFVELAETAEPLLAGPVQATWRRRLEVEHGNLREALRFSIDRGESWLALRLGGALWRFWLDHGYLSEGRAWLDQALELERSAEPAARPRALAGAGILAHYQGDYTRARGLSEECLALARTLDDAYGVAVALTGLALVARTQGEYEQADELFEEALAINRARGNRQQEARTLDRQGILAWFRGDYERALELLESSRVAFSELGDTAGIALTQLDAAMVTVSVGDLESPRDWLDESLAVLRSLGDRRSVAKALFSLGNLACERGDAEAADVYLEESLTLFIEFGDRWFAAVALERAGDSALTVGDAERAARLFGAASGQLEAIEGVPPGAASRERHDRNVAEAKSRLGSERFEAVWREGQATPLQATVDLVRAGAPPPPLDRSEGLTSRELDVLSLVADGLSDAEVAERLVVSVRTVHAHLRSVYRKLDIRSRAAATRYAVEHGLVGTAA